jgi:hypothetical protein
MASMRKEIYSWQRVAPQHRSHNQRLCEGNVCEKIYPLTITPLTLTPRLQGAKNIKITKRTHLSFSDLPMNTGDSHHRASETPKNEPIFMGTA